MSRAAGAHVEGDVAEVAVVDDQLTRGQAEVGIRALERLRQAKGGVVRRARRRTASRRTASRR